MAKRTKKNTETTEATAAQAAVETKPTKKARAKKAKVDASAEPTATPEDADELCVFAFRLTRAERDAIHAAAGPARASRFVKGLAIAAARGDVDQVGAILTEAKARIDG